MSKIKFLFIFIFFTTIYFSQIPTKCFEIESILVDGCDGSNEGKNEMVIFQNGPNVLNINNLRIDGAGGDGVIQPNKWPNTNNSFLGFCTNSSANSKLNTLNQAITQCGFLKQPTNGMIPIGAHVLIMTSTDFTAIPSYFQNLSDTLYVIFQCSGNTEGHFANFGSTSNRKLVLTNTATNCFDQVSYDRSLLEQTDGITGAEDGASVGFDWSGNPDYFNNGCQAPIVPSSVTFDAPSEICSGQSIDIVANITGGYTTLIWSGGTGSFSSTSSNETTYTPSQTETGQVTLNLKAFDLCGNKEIDKNFTFMIKQVNPMYITANPSTEICLGDVVTLVADGGLSYVYLWSTGESSNSIQVSPTIDSVYSVTGYVEGCTFTPSVFIHVKNCAVSEVDFPNVFTPNSDGLNDYFVPLKFSDVENKNFVILNRWGDIVYETKDQIIQWDGKSQDGVVVSQGVYFYKLLYNDSMNQEKEYCGFFHLQKK